MPLARAAPRGVEAGARIAPGEDYQRYSRYAHGAHFAGVDERANPMGAKGAGELGICGAGAAIANAVYSACGVRLHEYPVTIDRLLPQLLKV